jgi:hypothetical protein
VSAGGDAGGAKLAKQAAVGPAVELGACAGPGLCWPPPPTSGPAGAPAAEGAPISASSARSCWQFWLASELGCCAWQSSGLRSELAAWCRGGCQGRSSVGRPCVLLSCEWVFPPSCSGPICCGCCTGWTAEGRLRSTSSLMSLSSSLPPSSPKASHPASLRLQLSDPLWPV